MTEPPLTTGLLVLHGNRLEALAELVFGWLARHPLRPLEQEVFLVQSNGMGEWLKQQQALSQGICAATRVELPSRFVWQAYRAVLGRQAVPLRSALDKQPMAWRLMRLWGPAGAASPQALDGPFEPLRAWLGAGGADRRWQLAQQVADLFDQYQVYRGDWLADWAAGRDVLRRTPAEAPERALPVPEGQCWQPALWRLLLVDADADADAVASGRAGLHHQFLQVLQRTATGPVSGLPRRIVLFGTTHLPHQTLEAVTALQGVCQVILAVPNPCRYHWADIIDGREALRAARRRLPLRAAVDLAAVPLEDMHLHGHPLLAAWGRQARDFVRQLDAFDDAQQAAQRFALTRLDLFDDAPGRTLLERLQAQIRDLVPEGEAGVLLPEPDDRSIVFHGAHSALREVEVLHDQLLHLLAEPPGGQPLAPRDIVVMMPDVTPFVPAIRAVFGQHPRGHARHIPWSLADQRGRGQRPLLLVLELLLRAPVQRFTASELRGLLDLPSAARRFGLEPADVEQLAAWIEGADIRWGLHGPHRASLGLEACGDAHTWAQGLQRMLLGYACGEQVDGVFGIDPYGEVGGLSAALVGTLAELLAVLEAWWADVRSPRAPAAWADRARQLLAALFDAANDADRSTLAALDDALTRWLSHTEAAGFDEAVELAVFREAWLSGVDEAEGTRGYRTGGVTFCTLLPMRAVPFEVVCLLGMNDGDYPRRSLRSDFDLMGAGPLARPGDRSRRDDDRQLMLDAVLSARRVLYVSWVCRSQRDNQPQQASVLVGQLRDHLARLCGAQALAQRTSEHPLQPFSRRYFDAAAQPPGLFTYALEWRAALEQPASEGTDGGVAQAGAPALAPRRPGDAWSLESLARWLRNPVKVFFRQRLQVVFPELDAGVDDDEPFAANALERWQLGRRLIEAALGPASAADTASPGAALQRALGHLQRAGELPLGAPGAAAAQAWLQALGPLLQAWAEARQNLPHERDPLRLHWQHPADEGLALVDVIGGLRGGDVPGQADTWLELIHQPLKLSRTQKRPPGRPDRLLGAWLRSLGAAAAGRPLAGVVVTPEGVLQLPPMDPVEAAEELAGLLQACREGLQADSPMPTALRTGLAWLSDPDDAAAAAVAYDGVERSPGEGREACLARLFPDARSLLQAPGFAEATQRLYAPFRRWLDTTAWVAVPLPRAEGPT